MLGISLELSDEILVGGSLGVAAMKMVFALSLYFLPNSTDFLNFAFKICVFFNEEAVDVVEFSLQRDLQVVNYVLDLFFEVGEVIFKFLLLLFDFVLEGRNVVLFFTQQEQQIWRKYLSVV